MSRELAHALLPVDAPQRSRASVQDEGVFIALAGPSGAGKDSLIRGARIHFGSSRDVVFVRRAITREPDDHEDHDPMTPLQFRVAAEAGAFSLWWQANGLSYGLPRAVHEDLRRGAVVVANVSRDVLPRARETFPRHLVVHVTASIEHLRERLAKRGREDDDEQGARLARSMLREQAVEADIRIENDGALDKALRDFIGVIHLYIPSQAPGPQEAS